MKKKLLKIWKYLWYKPIYFHHTEEIELDGNKHYEDEDRWYVAKRKTTWLLLLFIIILPLFISGGIVEIKDYIKNLFKINATWLVYPKNISFKRKLDVVYYITKYQ